MKKYIVLAAGLMSGLVAMAQSANDPIIMTVAGTAVPRSEFEYSFNKNNTDGVIDKKNVEEYVDLFINYKLKVQAALDARIDTTQAFLTEFAQYRDQQIVPTFVTDEDMLEEAHKVYDQTVQSIGPDGLVRPAHILIMIPQKAAEDVQQKAKERIDSIYNALKAGANFEELAKQVSQDTGSGRRGGLLGWLSKGQTVKEFEDAAFALQPGEMSKPVLSPYGWHIILMKERKQFEPFEFHKENILKFLEQRGARNSISERKIDEMVKNADGQLTKSRLMEQRADSLSEKDLSMRYLIKEYHDGLSILRIRVEKGLFKKGDNKLIDREVFKVSDVKVDSVKGFPIDATYGKLIKAPQTYADVRGLVTADLQDELEREWVAELRRRYTFTVNEDVLKTVNKHE